MVRDIEHLYVISVAPMGAMAAGRFALVDNGTSTVSTGHIADKTTSVRPAGDVDEANTTSTTVSDFHDYFRRAEELDRASERVRMCSLAPRAIPRVIGTDQKKEFSMIVDAGTRVRRRRITSGTALNGITVITRGLKPSERKIVNCLQRVRPNYLVKLKLVAASPATITHKSAR